MPNSKQQNNPSQRRKGTNRGGKGKSAAKHNVSASTLLFIFFLVVCLPYVISKIQHSEPSITETTAAEPVAESAPTPAATAPTSRKKATPTRKTSTARRSAALDEIDYEGEALPSLNYAASTQVLRRRGYSLSFNAEYHVPNWVFYELLRSELTGKTKRTNNFMPDPDLKTTESPQLNDYRNTGYDRGHIAPAADFSWDSLAMSESFYLSNICPQGHDFNAGIWLDLENKVRDWARRDSAICIAAGPVLTDRGFPKPKEYLRHSNKVVIPQYFYKVILSPFGDEPKAIGFIMPNRNSKERLQSFAVTVDSVEALTGIDFFSILPDDVERRIEASYNLQEWF